MASVARKIKPELKLALQAEAGGKCANPGCSTWRTHIHHIKHWAVYRAHDPAHMIAVCPSCHDEIHYGRLSFSDDDLYRWKGVPRIDSDRYGLLYVEPSETLSVLAGSVTVETKRREMAVFRFLSGHALSLRVLDGDILQVSTTVADRSGRVVLRVLENHVRVARDARVQFEMRAGKARVLVPATREFVEDWVIEHMREHDPTYAADGVVTALELSVEAPGEVRVQGCWQSAGCAVVITQDAFCMCRATLRRPIALVGEGRATRFVYSGAVSEAMFGFA